MMTVPLLSTEARNLPSGEKATELILSAWPLRTRGSKNGPVGATVAWAAAVVDVTLGLGGGAGFSSNMSQTDTEKSSLPLAIRDFLGEPFASL